MGGSTRHWSSVPAWGSVSKGGAFQPRSCIDLWRRWGVSDLFMQDGTGTFAHEVLSC